MSLHSWFLVVLFPLALGVVVFAFRQRLRAQLVSIVLGAVVHAAVLIAFEILPEGGLNHHGNSWQGYAMIELGPILLVLVVVAVLRSLRFQSGAMSAIVAAAIPLSYWAGLLIAVSVAVTTGIAVP